jgi:ubiquinone/menaquinone biosynthesis C-methylase UbiE
MNGSEILTGRRDVFRARNDRYARAGFDRIAAAEFVIEAGGKLSGPALDIGTGKGLAARALARRGLNVVSVDVDAEEQALARFLAEEEGLAERIRFVSGDASELPFSRSHFGCAVMVGVLHHLENPIPSLDEMARVLRPSGTAVLADFSRNGLEIVARVHREDGREHPVTGATPETAAEFLCLKGFTVEARLSGHHHDVIVLTK